MVRLRYTLIIVLSLLVIYSGVGISVCSCLTSEVACFFCSTPCSGCEHDDEGADTLHAANDSDATCNEESAATCEDEGCSINIYKVNLAQQSVQSPLSILSFELFCGLLPDFHSLLLSDKTEVQAYAVPPPLVGGRQYLAMYSVLVI